MKGKGIYVAATKQHVGKTTTCLALMSGIRKRLGNRIGFQKPVGQTHVLVEDEHVGELKVDKDVKLFKEYFSIPTRYSDMSPVVIPSGYTRRFLDGDIKEEEQITAVKQAFANIEKESDFTVVEGTGHCGVGHIVNLDNARVASLLGLDMLLVVNGGLGSAFDELALNRLMCLHYDVKVKGVLINKVHPDKVEMISEYFAKALKRWDIPLLGVVPDAEYLGRCTMLDYEQLFSKKMISGSKEGSLWHYDQTALVATDLNHFLKKLQNECHSKTLFVTNSTRADIILGFLTHKAVHEEYWGEPWHAAMILAGTSALANPHAAVTGGLMTAIQRQSQPILASGKNSYETMRDISNFTAKLNHRDVVRTTAAINHYEQYIDYDKLLA